MYSYLESMCEDIVRWFYMSEYMIIIGFDW